MAQRGRPSRTILGRGSRRSTSWVLGPKSGLLGTFGASFAASGSAIGGIGSTSGVDGLTLVRTRGELMMYLTSADAVNAGFHGAFGVGVVTADAFTIGVTAVPTPIADEDWNGWFYHRYVSLHAPGPIAVATAAQETLQNATFAGALRVEVDSKAMRKIPENMTTFCAIELEEIGASGLEWLYNSRELVKLA